MPKDLLNGSKKTFLISIASPVFGLALGVLLSSKYLTLSCAKSSITLLVTYKKAEKTHMRQ